MRIKNNKLAVDFIIMNFKPSILIVFVLHLGIIACDSKKTSYEKIDEQVVEPITEIKYSKRFTISYYEDFKKIEVRSPWPNSVDTLFYIITSNSKKASEFKNRANTTVFKTGPTSVVCFSTTHLPYLEMIGESAALTGFPTTDYIYSKHFRKKVDEGLIQDLGPSNEINFETLLSLNPDMIFAFSMGDDLAMIHKIEISGIPVALNADYLEDHPLGRAEWIKFIAAFFNKDAEADSIFRAI
jgi:iron complex transport system substrate-binding protein